MVLSRISALTKPLLRKQISNKTLIRCSHGAWTYRKATNANHPLVYTCSELIIGFAWWWMLWHLIDEYDMVTGEFTYPNPADWTDEELGVPTREQYEAAHKKKEEEEQQKEKSKGGPAGCPAK